MPIDKYQSQIDKALDLSFNPKNHLSGKAQIPQPIFKFEESIIQGRLDDKTKFNLTLETDGTLDPSSRTIHTFQRMSSSKTHCSHW